MTEYYVIDPSALMQAYIQDTYTPHMKALLSLLGTANPPELHLLEIGLAESTNVLWKHVSIYQTITPDVARKAILNIRAIPLYLHLVEDYLDEALTIGLDHRLPIYDSLYIALARALNHALITADGKQERIARQIGVTIKPMADFTPTT